MWEGNMEVENCRKKKFYVKVMLENTFLFVYILCTYIACAFLLCRRMKEKLHEREKAQSDEFSYYVFIIYMIFIPVSCGADAVRWGENEKNQQSDWILYSIVRPMYMYMYIWSAGKSDCPEREK